MQFRRRLTIVGVLALAAAVTYATARYYAPALMAYVVEQTLIEKAPPGTDVTELRDRFRATLAAEPSDSSKMQKIMRLSQYLEKVQQLTRPELDILMRQFQDSAGNRIFDDSGNLFAADNV